MSECGEYLLGSCNTMLKFYSGVLPHLGQYWSLGNASLQQNLRKRPVEASKTTILTTLNSSAGTDYFLQEPFPRQSTTILRYIKTIVDNCNKFTTGRDGTTVESFDYVCVGEMDTARLASCACAIFRDRFLCKADSEKHHVMSLTKSFRL